MLSLFVTAKNVSFEVFVDDATPRTLKDTHRIFRELRVDNVDGEGSMFFSKCRLTSIRLHSIALQKDVIFIATYCRT
jgi:hypothetical protein